MQRDPVICRGGYYDICLSNEQFQNEGVFSSGIHYNASRIRTKPDAFDLFLKFPCSRFGVYIFFSYQNRVKDESIAGLFEEILMPKFGNG